MMMNANRFTIILLRGSSLLRPVRQPITQHLLSSSIGRLPKCGDHPQPFFRAVSINPYNGKDYRDEERELQRKKCSHGLKVEWVDFAPTIMDRAKSRLRESAMQRKRSVAATTTTTTTGRSSPKKVSVASNASPLQHRPQQH